MWINPENGQIDAGRECPAGSVPLLVEEKPVVDLCQVAVLDAPALVDREWRRGWRIEARELESARADMLAAINAERDRQETLGFTYLNKRFQSDERSAARIANAALTATTALATGQAFSVVWAAADNTAVTLDAAGMLAMQAGLTGRAADLHYYSRSLKEQALAATTIEELAAIDIEAGWPV
jgi:hypothetical protein